MSEVTAVNLTKRIAVLDDGRTMPVTNMFDDAGDDTSDPSEAFTFVCGSANEWFTVRTDAFEGASAN